MTIQRIYGACPHDCPDTCGVITEVEDTRAINFYGDPNHPTGQITSGIYSAIIGIGGASSSKGTRPEQSEESVPPAKPPPRLDIGASP